MTDQLRMIWPEGRKPPLCILPKGYSVRRFRPSDEQAYVRMLNRGDLGEWDLDRMRSILENPLAPGTVYFITYNDVPVATTCSQKQESDWDDDLDWAEVGWVTVDPAHRGRGLGLIICAVVVDQLQRLGYKHIYLKTDDWRLPAIKTYLRMGFQPLINSDEMNTRWRAVAEKLDWSF
ncbi:MAG: GNAT family N-acetyltransferase [Limnochordia bacterium]|nr:GNAT family N-acetyltransferase [Limnochordia bacterium]